MDFLNDFVEEDWLIVIHLWLRLING
jgi:hypothetical protein